MNTGQTLITIGAIILLSVVLLRINTNFLTTQTVLSNTRGEVMAISLATSTMEKASSLSFDAKSDTNSVVSTNQLTPYSDLGPEAGETSDTLFNDFDDYNGFSRQDTLASGVYTTICKVEYVNPLAPDDPVNNETWHKKLTVKVTGNTMIQDWNTMVQDTITFSSIFSYWFFLNMSGGG